MRENESDNFIPGNEARERGSPELTFNDNRYRISLEQLTKNPVSDCIHTVSEEQSVTSSILDLTDENEADVHAKRRFRTTETISKRRRGRPRGGTAGSKNAVGLKRSGGH